MLDLLIRGGDVVTPHGVENCDIGIAGETIAAVAAPGTLPAESAGRSIDATGRIVMPGGIDPHVHLNRMRRRDTSGQSRTFFTAKWRISLVNPCVSADITGHRVIFADTLVC